jgi:hypothetical protein
MKYFFSLVFLVALVAGCKEKRLSPEQLENKLMKTMNNYLDKNGNANVKFTVKSVVFYPEKEYYLCEFRVNMHGATIDTIGTMAATISKDFNTVKRRR